MRVNGKARVKGKGKDEGEGECQGNYGGEEESDDQGRG